MTIYFQLWALLALVTALCVMAALRSDGDKPSDYGCSIWFGVVWCSLFFPAGLLICLMYNVGPRLASIATKTLASLSREL